MLHIDNLSFSFDSQEVLNAFSLCLRQNEIGCLIGASGSGKTTLFKLLTGRLPLQKGSFSINGILPPKAHSHAGFMTQDPFLLPWRTLLDNLLLGKELGKKPKENKTALKEQGQAYLRDVGLEGWENKYPEQLSGGMRQRAALAAILLQKHPLLLLDEPFAALDVYHRQQMINLLLTIRQRFGTTMLMATHDFRDALSLADRIFLLAHGKLVKEWKVSSEIRNDPLLFHHCCNEIQEEFRILSFCLPTQ